MPHRLVETVQFSEWWHSAIDLGVIDPVGESKLQELAHLLSVDPYYFPLFETTEETADLRWVDFLPGSSVRVEISHPVVEDDQAVYLEIAEVIYPAQQSFPGFEV